MDSSRDYLKEYLNYYIQLERPGYAVLITGAWGTGKTHQVKEAIPEERRYYISLFGLTDIDQVSRAVFAEVHPSLAKFKTFLDKAEDISKSMSGLFALGALGTSGIKSLFKEEISTERVLVFDDLERSSLDIDEKLGIINLFVEQLGCRVVVIANDKEIADRFDEKKEKLIGQTIRVEPRVDAAFEAFAKGLNAGEGEFIRRHKAKILDTFKISRRESLRILKYVIEDVARLRSQLADRFAKHDQAMGEFVQIFSAMDIETRYGILAESDLRNRQHSYMISTMNSDKGTPLPIKTVSDKYSPIDLTNTIISDDLAVSLFIQGNYQSEEIASSLQASPYFSNPSEIPPWLGLYQFYKISPVEAQSYLDRLIEQIAQHKVVIPGEILHSFFLLLLMSKYGLVKESNSQIVKRAKQYLQELLDMNILADSVLEQMHHGDFRSGHRGYGFWVEDGYLAEANEIRQELIKIHKVALESQFPEFARELLRVMNENAQEFYYDLCSNSVRAARFSSLPVLASIPPSEFFVALMACSPADRRIVASALKDRYEGSLIDNELANEKPWISDLLTLVDTKISELGGFESLQLKMLFGQHFRDRVSEFTTNP